MKIRPARIIYALWSRYFPIRNRKCSICGNKLVAFIPMVLGRQVKLPLMDQLQMVGSDVSQFECPWCGCNDRERHLWMYIQESGLVESLPDSSVLHFAPEKRLPELIAKISPRQYLQADLYPVAPHIQTVDMLATGFPDEEFDLIMANHVLEHVSSVEQALEELIRILKPGGHIIVQTPFSSLLEHTWSDPGITTDSSRLQAYGQEDHVRLFGKDIFQIIERVGFESRVMHHRDLPGEFSGATYGVNEQEPFFLFRKNVVQ